MSLGVAAGQAMRESPKQLYDYLRGLACTTPVPVPMPSQPAPPKQLTAMDHSQLLDELSHLLPTTNSSSNLSGSSTSSSSSSSSSSSMALHPKRKVRAPDSTRTQASNRSGRPDVGGKMPRVQVEKKSAIRHSDSDTTSDSDEGDSTDEAVIKQLEHVPKKRSKAVQKKKEGKKPVLVSSSASEDSATEDSEEVVEPKRKKGKKGQAGSGSGEAKPKKPKKGKESSHASQEARGRNYYL